MTGMMYELVRTGEIRGKAKKRPQECFSTRMEGDIKRTLDYLAKDAEYRIPARNEPLRGLDSIRSELERWQVTLSDTRYELLNVASTDHLVFQERIDTQHMTNIGRDVHVYIGAIYELGPDGKIVNEREYFDMKELEAQIGGA
jgi:limonene-1,2-epoxide hydrolase